MKNVETQSIIKRFRSIDDEPYQMWLEAYAEYTSQHPAPTATLRPEQQKHVLIHVGFL